MAWQKRFHMRLDPLTDRILKAITDKYPFLKRSQIIRMALLQFLNSHKDDVYPEFEKLKIAAEVNDKLNEIKQLRYITHIKRSADNWIATTEKAIKGFNYKDVRDPKFSVLGFADRKTLNRLLKLQKEVIELCKKYEAYV